MNWREGAKRNRATKCPHPPEMFHQEILKKIKANPLFTQPGKIFDCFAVERMLQAETPKPEPYPIALALPALVAQGELIQVGLARDFYGSRNVVVRLAREHENVREQEMKRLAGLIQNPPPTQGELL